MFLEHHLFYMAKILAFDTYWFHQHATIKSYLADVTKQSDTVINNTE